MKILTITMVALVVLFIGSHQMQGRSMAESGGEMTMKQTMKSKGPSMDSGAMNDRRSYVVPTDEELRKQLTPLQYEVTKKEGTEPPFNNAYWDNKEPGIYVDIISGVPLFSSNEKYKSGTGWPSFTKPIDSANIVEIEDRSLFSVRTEVRGRLSDSHLGHVFTDGPAPTGLRYCMNSAALKFIAKDDLVKEGYGEYLKLFK